MRWVGSCLSQHAIRLIILFILFLAASSAHAVDFEQKMKGAKIYSVAAPESSFCQWKNDSQNPITGYRTEEMVRIASITKIFTSYLALKKFSPFHRFETQVIVTPVDTNVYDVHIAGGEDPNFTYEKVFFLISELNKKGIQQIRRLSFDDKLRIFLSFRDSFDNVWSESYVYNPGQKKDYIFNTVPPKDTLGNLKLLMTTSQWSTSHKNKYAALKKKMAAKSVTMTSTPQMKTKEVVFENEVSVSNEAQVFTLKSIPIYQYLKDMNKYSINFMADQLFLISGGVEALHTLLLNDVGLHEQDYEIHTGSGLPDRRGSKRKDNKATCVAVLKTMDSMSQFLNSYEMTQEQKALLGRAQIRMSDVMLVAGLDADATYQPGEPFDEQEGSTVVKTGTLTENPAFNLAGYVSTKNGIEWFGIFLNRTWSSFRRSIVSDLIKENGGAVPVGSGPKILFADFVSLDQYSGFDELQSPPLLKP